MTGEEKGDCTEPESNLNYLAQYRSNLRNIQDHLLGNDGHPLSPSWFPPSSYWTASEKAIFFHALTIHSRLRPDLIAAEIESKNVVDVCIYLSLLEDAASTHNGPSVQRKKLAAAMEVSEDWVALEEEQAAAILAQEPIWEAKDWQVGRDEAIKAKRTELRARRGQGKTSSNERDRIGEKRRREVFDGWKSEQDEVWEREDIFRELDYPRLKVLDAILREDEERRLVGTTNAIPVVKETQATIRATSQHTIDPALRAEHGQSIAESSAISPTPPIPFASSLTSASVPADCAPEYFEAPSSPQPSTSAPPDYEMESDAAVPSALSPRSRRRYQKRLYMRRKRAMLTGVAVDEQVRRLKPGRKGKGKKKPTVSAEQHNEEGGGDSMIGDVDPVRDAVGSRPDESASFPRIPELVGQEKTTKSNIGGKTLPYKVKEKMASTRVDAEFLRRNDMDLFHLAGLGKLMKLYRSLYPVAPTVNTRISDSTIQLLQAHVVRFVTEAVHRAIVSREQERALKLHTKVWKIADDQIVTANVMHGLEMMGVDRPDKRKMFETLLERSDFNADEGKARKTGSQKDDMCGSQGADTRGETTDVMNVDADEYPELGDTREGDSDNNDQETRLNGLDENTGAPSTSTQDQAYLPSFSLHRDIYTPLIRLSPSSPHTAALLSFRKESEIYSTVEGENQPRSEFLMASETDDDALFAELQEEEELDAKDGMMDEVYEHGMWTQLHEDAIQGNSDSDHTGEDEDVDAGYGASLRFKEPDVNSRIKSQVYILNSD